MAGWVAGWVYELKIRLNSASVGVELKLKLKLSWAKTYLNLTKNLLTFRVGWVDCGGYVVGGNKAQTQPSLAGAWAELGKNLLKT